MPEHATQVFLHNPQALRIELRLDDARLLLWWSPGAGSNFDALERNYSNRDDHLAVFERIQFEDLPLSEFRSCDYDPYRAILHYANREIELATVPDLPVVLVTARRGPLSLRFKTYRHDTRVAASNQGWTVRHEEGGRGFEFTAVVGPGEGAFKHQPIFEPGRAIYSRVDLTEGQTLVVGVGLAGEGIAEKATQLAARPLDAIHAATAERLSRDLADGTPVFRRAPELDAFYAINRRSLHGAIDDSGALRAALKEVYYLIWVRDGAFCFNSQAATGWMHKHLEWCRFLLANPLTIGPEDPLLPPGRTFGQLVAHRFGKMEEDGPYYVAWSVFTAWVQTRDASLLTPENLALLEEMVRWVEAYDYDEARGLFRERMVDESPYKGSRDDGWDAAIGDLQREGGVKYRGKHILYSYSAYMNLLMFGTYSMLAALPGMRLADAYRAKAQRLWEKLAPFLPQDGLPPAGELVMEDGEVILAPPYIPKTACYLWAFSLPGLAPIPHIDALRLRLLRDVLARPKGHWINAITALIAAVDPLTCEEQELARAIHYLVVQGQRSGKYLPMPGTMPEKYDVPDGAYYDDIRPQAFAQSSFLAACTSLGVRRLPFGLAVRPTRFLEKLDSYAWRDTRIDFVFGSAHQGVMIDGLPLPHSLQLPDEALRAGRVRVSVGQLPAQGVLARSNVALCSVRQAQEEVAYTIDAPGLSELAFTRKPRAFRFEGSAPAEAAWTEESGLAFLRFHAVGRLTLHCTF
jgi:hypothetical protein